MNILVWSVFRDQCILDSYSEVLFIVMHILNSTICQDFHCVEHLEHNCDADKYPDYF